MCNYSRTFFVVTDSTKNLADRRNRHLYCLLRRNCKKILTWVFLADQIENFPNPERRNADELNNNSKRKRAVGKTATKHGDEDDIATTLYWQHCEWIHHVHSIANRSAITKDNLDSCSALHAASR
jgi:hypothetical protein